MIFRIYDIICKTFTKSYEFVKDIYEFPGNIKQLIKEHGYYKTEYLSLIKKYGELLDIHKELLSKIL